MPLLRKTVETSEQVFMAEASKLSGSNMTPFARALKPRSNPVGGEACTFQTGSRMPRFAKDSKPAVILAKEI